VSPSARTGKVLIVQEVNDYEVPLLPDETPEQAFSRYLDTGPDTFYARTRSREKWVEDKQEKEVTA